MSETPPASSIRLGPFWSTLSLHEFGERYIEILVQIDLALSAYEPGYRYSPKFRSGAWDGKQHLFQKGTMKFPSGLVKIVVGVLKQFDSPVTINRTYDPVVSCTIPFSIGEQREYQAEIIQQAIAARRATIISPTGSGKTEMMMAIVAHWGQPTLVLVHKILLFDQTVKRFQDKFGVGMVGMVHADKLDYASKRIVIGMVPTLASRMGLSKSKKKTIGMGFPQIDQNLIFWLQNSCKVLCIDECHHASASTWYDVVKQCWAVLRYGFSATPDQNEPLRNLKLMAATGPPIEVISMKDLSDMGYLAKPKIKMIYVKSTPHWDYAETYKMWTENEDGHKLTAEQVRGKEFAVVLVELIEHGRALEAIIPDSRFIHGAKSKANQKYNEETLRDFRLGKFRCLIGTSVLGEGMDLPEIRVLVNASGLKSRINVIQKFGRLMRRKATGPNEADMFDFMVDDRSSDDDVGFLLDHAFDRKSHYLSESYEVEMVGAPPDILAQLTAIDNMPRKRRKNRMFDEINERSGLKAASQRPDMTEEEKNETYALIERFMHIRWELGGKVIWDPMGLRKITPEEVFFQGALRLMRFLRDNNINWTSYLTTQLRAFARSGHLDKCGPNQMTGMKATQRWMKKSKQLEGLPVTLDTIRLGVQITERSVRNMVQQLNLSRALAATTVRQDLSGWWLLYEFAAEKEVSLPECLREQYEQAKRNAAGIKSEDIAVIAEMNRAFRIQRSL